MGKHINLSYIKSSVSDDKDFIRQLLTVFLKNLRPDFDTLRGASNASDQQAVKRAAHKMKSGFKSLGMTRLSELSQRIETMGNEGADINNIRVLVAEMEALILEAYSEVKAHLAGEV